jgi:hypothetical protein
VGRLRGADERRVPEGEKQAYCYRALAGCNETSRHEVDCLCGRGVIKLLMELEKGNKPTEI